MKLLTQTKKIDPKDFELTPQQKAFYQRYLLSQKDESLDPPAELSDLSLDQEYSRLRQKRRIGQAAQKGYPWTVYLIDSETEKVVYVTGRQFDKQYAADRCGRRYIKRFEETGSFDPPKIGSFVKSISTKIE